MPPQSIANLAAMPGFVEMGGVSVKADGSVDPLTQLFRSSFVGVETGPMISQVIACGGRMVVVVCRRHTLPRRCLEEHNFAA